jgi:hypothetical protein
MWPCVGLSTGIQTDSRAAFCHPARGGRIGTILAFGQFFRQGGAYLLIVEGLFFIQRGDGEVAEWSKARPC